jgi:hypothetical protein
MRAPQPQRAAGSFAMLLVVFRTGHIEDIDELIRLFPPPAGMDVTRRGDRIFKRRIASKSHLTTTVFDDDWADDPAADLDALAREHVGKFLRNHAGLLAALRARGVACEMDYGVDRGGAYFNRCFDFPAEYLTALTAAGVGLEISVYPDCDEREVPIRGRSATAQLFRAGRRRRRCWALIGLWQRRRRPGAPASPGAGANG